MSLATESRVAQAAEEYRPLDADSLPAYLAGVDSCAGKLGGGADEWQVDEVGDGNLNLVFIVRGSVGSLVVKQALPYVRLVGESWPLPLKRAYFEHEALITEIDCVPELVPAVYHYDDTMALTVMEHLTPHIILRKGLIAGIRYPNLAEHVAEFMAQTLFKTSDLYLPASKKKARNAVFCDNIELCKITEDLVFTDPYRIAELNRWTTPQLDDMAAKFRGDAPLKLEAQILKEAFMGRAEALIHGDLHSGSIMVTETETKMIDPEFAFYGPRGFDVGAVIGNLLLAYFSQTGHATADDDRIDYGIWILEQIGLIWEGFRNKFLRLWETEGRGDIYLPELFDDPAGATTLAAYRDVYMKEMFHDSLGFAGMKMVRRILGLAHVEDLETIEDPDLRATCETKALLLGRELIVNRRKYDSVASVVSHAQKLQKGAEQ
ncbi:S-methyl-5-thioribose kinase [Pelagibius sp. Alg239-R121]|uniref:S-methyl-5-thioribose kinase n=1 Tax=Pelagibius sp. Alg239-R121 TaxID=2993448 RepID=UPI0024A724CC|nr:S-methyl-5-thioribose kinase [Pelagibius sp. Alg239-R121]